MTLPCRSGHAPRRLWWATLRKDSPRYASWHALFPDDEIPLITPRSIRMEFVGEGELHGHLLDFARMSHDQTERLCTFVAALRGGTPGDVATQIIEHGFPVRAEDVTLGFDMRGFV